MRADRLRLYLIVTLVVAAVGKVNMKSVSASRWD